MGEHRRKADRRRVFSTEFKRAPVQRMVAGEKTVAERERGPRPQHPGLERLSAGEHRPRRSMKLYDRLTQAAVLRDQLNSGWTRQSIVISCPPWDGFV